MTRIFSLALALCLGIVSFLCFQWSVAAFESKTAHDLVKGWVDTTYVAVPDEVATAFEHNLQAQRLDPLNPRHRFRAAELFEWRAFLQRKTPGYWKSNIDMAKKEYMWIITQVPASAYAWVSYAESLAELDVFDQRATSAIHRAIQLGPWDPGVLRRTIHVGMKHWNRWPEDVKQVVKDTVRRVFATQIHHADRVDLFVYKNTLIYDWEEELLPLIATEAQLELYQNRKSLN